MKTVVPFKNLTLFAAIIILVAVTKNSSAQSGLLSDGLRFDNPSLVSGADLQTGAIYLFQDVYTNTDAVVRIDSLVNGATVNSIDDNGNGMGYKDAFQPKVKSGGVIGKSYAVFSVGFYLKGTSTPAYLDVVNATALDIDGNATLKEFAEMRLGNGATATYMSSTTDLSLLQILQGDFIGENILGIERTGIDTASYGNMFTSTNHGISGFSVKYGTTTLVPSQSARQYSLYMKGFNYPSQTTLPLELLSFGAMLKDTKKVNLFWTTLWEKNLSHFTVERSFDGKTFSQAGVVFGVGNSDYKTNYSLTDDISKISAGIIYYRLKLQDEDGKYGYSEVRVIRVNNKEQESISLTTYPNPVVNELRVTIPNSWQGKEVKYEIYNAGGRMIKTVSSSSASQTEIINMSSVNAGLYIVRAINGNDIAQQKIIKN